MDFLSGDTVQYINPPQFVTSGEDEPHMTQQPDIWSAHTLLDADQQHVWHPLTQHAPFLSGKKQPLVITHAQGSKVFDTNGESYLDGAAGLWCVNVGYGRQELIAAATEQLQRLAFYPLTQTHPAAIQLAQRLAEYLPHTPRIYFSNSGSEANEVAFKTVRQFWRQAGFPDKTKIISRHRGYHGSSLGALAATGQEGRKRGYGPMPADFIQVVAPDCYRCPFGLAQPTCGTLCASEFERRIVVEGADTVAAVIIEPIIGGGGVLVPPAGYLEQVEAICRKYQVLLIVDEVVTGFGRTGTMFGHTAFGIRPDVVTMAKGMTSGYIPMAATAFSEKIFHAFVSEDGESKHVRHINTYSGHPVAAAVALANLAVIENEQLADQATLLGNYLRTTLQEALAGIDCVGEIRGRGLLVGIELVDPISGLPISSRHMQAVSTELLLRKIIMGKTTDTVRQHNNVLIVAPPLVILPEELNQLVEAVQLSIRAVLAQVV